MRHAALAAILVALPAVSSAGDYGFTESLRGIRDLVRPAAGEPRFIPADFVKPRRRPGLENLDQEQANLFAETMPATFIVRIGERGQRGSGTGSGYFIHPDGTGMTNVHVVGTEIGKEVEIETVRGVKKARILAVAPGRDIAIIKVSNDAFNDWTALTMGAGLAAGHNVFAIGNPLDQGVHLHARHRQPPGAGQDEPVDGRAPARHHLEPRQLRRRARGHLGPSRRHEPGRGPQRGRRRRRLRHPRAGIGPRP